MSTNDLISYRLHTPLRRHADTPTRQHANTHPLIMSDTSFTGFSNQAIQFLRDLAVHNQRDWFNPRKEFFRSDLQEPLAQLVLTTTGLIRRARIPGGSNPTFGAFRFYRHPLFPPVTR